MTFLFRRTSTGWSFSPRRIKTKLRPRIHASMSGAYYKTGQITYDIKKVHNISSQNAINFYKKTIADDLRRQ